MLTEEVESRNDDAVDNLKVEVSPPPSAIPIRSYGTLHCGYETMSAAWPTMDHVFSYGGSAHSSCSRSFPNGRPPRDLLSRTPVDMLVVDMGHAQPNSKLPVLPWTDLIASSSRRPILVVESWPGHSSTWEQHPMSKGLSHIWADLGYQSRFKLVPATAVGGAIGQIRLVVIRIQRDLSSLWTWAPLESSARPRPMGNLLTPFGLLPRNVKRQTHHRRSGTHPDSRTDPMPSEIGAWIDTPEGARRLQATELAKGLGVEGSLLTGELSARWLARTTCVHIWEYLSRCFSGGQEPDGFTVFPGLRELDITNLPRQAPLERETNLPPFAWAPPDLSPGGPWHRERVANLKRAAASYPDREQELFEQGLVFLDTHRNNYDTEGADVKRLQLLWWEFPPEHWDELRDGCDMGFLSSPERIIHPNSPMDEAQLVVATQFVEELISLGVLRHLHPGEALWTNAPLFCIPKPGQVGEWRVIADCKAGGQNAHIGPDPVYLNRPLHILEQMYTGGFSAVVDASKFFYQFPVREEDQKYFGVVHPLTGDHLAYTGLPMGSGSSPGLAGRFGLAFVRMLQELSSDFSNEARLNCWWSSLTCDGYDPSLGHGFSLHQVDGSPSVKIWVHVDDFLLHGPTLESTRRALTFFLDKALDVGMLCHPKKLKPPSQLQRYCGFEFDTRSDPILRIPTDKHDKCRAMVAYLLSFSEGDEVSRLALSVVAGTLESVADATPNRLGHTYLRSTHSLIHPEGHDPGRQIYYTFAKITGEVLREMTWWDKLLRLGNGRQLRFPRSATLVPSWGDGSGTGTGGTIEIPGQDMKLWMGQWSPTVFQSSNWKELKTLLLTLQHLATLPGEPMRGVTLFYFTDNSATYYISAAGSSTSPGLHALEEDIQLLTLHLGCCLQVVHVPGLVMIDQGTDGLSRGVWVSSFHLPVDHRVLNAAVFAPLSPDRALVAAYVDAHDLPRTWKLHDYRHFRGRTLFDHMAVVFPPPECARTCLIQLLEAWVERPATTSGLLFVPRILAGFWTGLSRHVLKLDEIWPCQFPLASPPLLPIPIVVLHLPPHSRALPSIDRRLVRPARVQNERQHELLADYVRRLPQDPPSG